MYIYIVKPSPQARYRQLPSTSSVSLWPFANDPSLHPWPWATTGHNY